MSMINKPHATGSFSFGEFVWWMGVVEDRGIEDETLLARVKVRIFGYYTKDRKIMPHEDFVFANVMHSPMTSAFYQGMGWSPHGLKEGCTVLGFFLDGHNAQNPIIIGTFGTINPDPRQDPEEGFTDPNGLYPMYDELESDVSRLARNRDGCDEKTIVQWQKDNRIEGCKKPKGGAFQEPQCKYGAQYPFNLVFETEPKHKIVKRLSDVKLTEPDIEPPPPENQGHVMEFDDSPGSERIKLHHKCGTFIEIFPDGTYLRKNKENSYTFSANDAYNWAKGDWVISCDNDVQVYAGNNIVMESKKDMEIRVGRNLKVKVEKNISIDALGDRKDETQGHHKIKAARIDLN